MRTKCTYKKTDTGIIDVFRSIIKESESKPKYGLAMDENILQ